MNESNYPNFQEIIGNIRNVLSAFQSFADVLGRAYDWYERNTDTITAYISAFADFGVWSGAVRRMKERQIVFTDNLSMELANEIYNSEDVESTVQNYYFGNNSQQMDALILRCEQSQQVIAHGSFFSESVTAYRMGHYLLACDGLFSLIDGILDDVTSKKKEVRFKIRIDEIRKKFTEQVRLSDIDKQLWCIFMSIHSFEESIFCYSDFSKPEPDSLSRDWVLHGRTRRVYTQYDVLKALLWLDAIIILANTSEQLENKEME